MFGVGASKQQLCIHHRPRRAYQHLSTYPSAQSANTQPVSLIPPQNPVPAVEKEPVSPAEPGSTLEPEHNIMSDQVRESATMPVAERVLMVFEGMNGCPAHTPATACKVNMDYGDFLKEDLIDWFMEAMTENSPISLTILNSNIPVSPAPSLSPAPSVF